MFETVDETSRASQISPLVALQDSVGLGVRRAGAQASLGALRAEAESHDRADPRHWWKRSSEAERALILENAALTRERIAIQDAAANRPLLPTEVDEVALIRATSIAKRLGAKLLCEISSEPAPPLILGRIDPTDLTILFGPGGVGKGLIACWWIARLIEAGRKVVIVDYENHEAEWGRRIEGFLGTSSDRAYWMSPTGPGWDVGRGAIWKHAGDIRELVLEFGADVLVIDSIVAACPGSDPMATDAPMRFAEATSSIGVPTLAIAHMTKSGDNPAYPFGSVFWHNVARVTWSLVHGAGDSRTLSQCKNNNGPRGGRYSLNVTWAGGRPTSVTEATASSGLEARIDEVLGNERLTVADIVLRLNAMSFTAVRADSVRKTLNRGAQQSEPHYVKEGGFWRVAP